MLEDKLCHAEEASLHTSPQGEGEEDEKAKGMVTGAASGVLGVGGAAVGKVREGASKLMGAMAGLWPGGKRREEGRERAAGGEEEEARGGGPAEGGEATEAARGEPEPKAKLNAALASALLGEIPIGEKTPQ